MRTTALAITAALSAVALATPPQYSIVHLGVVGADTIAQGNAVSPNGVYATGRSVASSGSARAFLWTSSGGMVGLPNLASPVRNYGVGNGVNNNGVVAGTAATTLSGSSPLPVIWRGGVVAQLTLPAGQTLGRAYALNGAETAVGSVNSGTNERGCVYGETSFVIAQVTDNGSYLRTAFGINDSNRVVGFGIDPNNAAANVGYVVDLDSNHAFTVGALPGRNGAICFGVSNAGHVVGSTMMNQGAGSPFIWTDAGGMVEIPLPVGTSQGSARAVNIHGWAVGTASSAFAIPFLYDGSASYRLADLIPAGTGWDLSTNTSSAALGISDNGVIVGTGMFNGSIRAFAMIPACIADFNGDGFIDFFDYDDYVNCFESGTCPPGKTADSNGDGFVDFFDYDAFVEMYETGC